MPCVLTQARMDRQILMKHTKSYSELSKYSDFNDRFDYLKLDGRVGRLTFGYDRHINQHFYGSHLWHRVRDHVIVRDNGCDLGVPGYEIYQGLLIHHINPMAVEDILHSEEWLIDPEYLITTTQRTHNAIHFANPRLLPAVVTSRSPNDTRLWHPSYRRGYDE